MTTTGASGGNRLPRDAAGYLDLNEGTGGIIAMCSCDGFLEVYKQDLTYWIQTPQTIDPDRVNPHTPFVAAVTDNVGSLARYLGRTSSLLLPQRPFRVVSGDDRNRSRGESKRR